MAGKTDVFENDLLKLIFNGTAIANIADNATTGAFDPLALGAAVDGHLPLAKYFKKGRSQ